MELLNLAIYYAIGCLLAAFLIWIGNQMVTVDEEPVGLAPYDWAFFSWGFVFWFLVMFIWLIFKRED